MKERKKHSAEVQAGNEISCHKENHVYGYWMLEKRSKKKCCATFFHKLKIFKVDTILGHRN